MHDVTHAAICPGEVRSGDGLESDRSAERGTTDVALRATGAASRGREQRPYGLAALHATPRR